MRHNHPLVIAMLTGFIASIAGCASMGRPEGGMFDEDPPVLVSSDPIEGGINVSKQRITMRFNENIKLDNANQKLTVSPPQVKMPRISSNAKTLTIELNDSLKENTTYSIDLGDAVQDNNESNPLESLSLLFSTGSKVDTLQIIGHLVNASNLEPITGAYVGIYRIDGNDNENRILADSLFRNKPMERAGKTDAKGFFKILGCAPGTYRLYSLIDGNTNYYYDMYGEDIAFYDEPIQLDENYVPDSTFVLYSFNEGKVMRYLDDCARPDSIHINVRFATWMPELPKLTFILPDSSRIEGDSVLIADVNPTFDTLSYWIRETSLLAYDTLNLELSYLYTDTLFNDVWKSEIIQLEKPAPQKPQEDADKDKKKGHKRKKKGEEAAADTIPADTIPPIVFMNMKMVSGNTIDIGQKPIFEVSEPLDSLHIERFHLQIQKDTIWEEMPLRLELDSLHPLRYTLYADPHFTPGGSYRLTADSAALHNIYGQPLAATKFTFKEKTPEDYAHLLFTITGYTGPAYVEILNGSDKPLQRSKVINGKAKFVNIAAGTYYARLVADANNNGRFDPGNLDTHLQPEKVFYFASELQLRANWSFDQSWDLNETPILLQKPEKVRINKPKKQTEKKSKNEEYLRRKGKL